MQTRSTGHTHETGPMGSAGAMSYVTADGIHYTAKEWAEVLRHREMMDVLTRIEALLLKATLRSP